MEGQRILPSLMLRLATTGFSATEQIIAESDMAPTVRAISPASRLRQPDSQVQVPEERYLMLDPKSLLRVDAVNRTVGGHRS